MTEVRYRCRNCGLLDTKHVPGLRQDRCPMCDGMTIPFIQRGLEPTYLPRPPRAMRGPFVDALVGVIEQIGQMRRSG